MTLQEPAQPRDRVGVEVVRRLVEQEHGLRLARTVGGGEQDACELHATPLTARQRAQLLIEDAGLEPEAGADARCLALGLVPTAGREVLLEPAVAGDGLVPRLLVRGVRHEFLGRGHVGGDPVQATGRQHPATRELVHVALTRILRQIAEVPGQGHRAAVRLALPGEDAHRGGLARAVAADQSDPITGLDAQGRPSHVEKDADAGPYLQVVDRDHCGADLSVVGAARAGRTRGKIVAARRGGDHVRGASPTPLVGVPEDPGRPATLRGDAPHSPVAVGARG